MNGKVSIRIGAEDRSSSVLRSLMKTIGDFGNSTVAATHKSVEAFRARALAVKDYILQETDAFERARKSALSHYETLEQINARIDAPKREAEARESAAAALERYNRLLEETKRRQDAMYAKRHNYNAFDPSTHGNLERLHAKRGGGAAPGGAVDAGVMQLAKSARQAIPALMMLNRAMGESSGAMGKAAQAMASIVGLSMAFGKMGVAIGAVQAAVQLASDYFTSRADKMLEAVKKRGEAVTARLDRKKENLERSQQAAVDLAEQKAASAVEKAADLAWEKIATINARNRMSDAQAESELAKMRSEKTRALLSAPDDVGRISAAWDYKIAEREAALVKERMEREHDAEKERIDVARNQLAVTQKNVEMLEAAAGEAGRIYNLAEQAGVDKGYVAQLKSTFESASARAKAEKDRAKEQERRVMEADAEFAANEIKRESSQDDANDKLIEARRRLLREEEMSAAAIAKQRVAAERELHQRRMDDLRAEIAKQRQSIDAQTVTRSYAQSEFDKAFAMYRDPSRAAAEIGEEKDYRADLDRLHRDARRYGGQWRIDELSALMSRGDTQGVGDALAEWRKSARFTPEVEAMVRASAAERTKTTAEDELRRLNDKIGEVSQKLETLAQARDGKLAGIEQNTGSLSSKLDELLRVKG